MTSPGAYASTRYWSLAYGITAYADFAADGKKPFQILLERLHLLL